MRPGLEGSLPPKAGCVPRVFHPGLLRSMSPMRTKMPPGRVATVPRASVRCRACREVFHVDTRAQPPEGLCRVGIGSAFAKRVDLNRSREFDSRPLRSIVMPVRRTRRAAPDCKSGSSGYVGSTPTTGTQVPVTERLGDGLQSRLTAVRSRPGTLVGGISRRTGLPAALSKSVGCNSRLGSSPSASATRRDLV